MELKQFRVKNFRSVNDSGDIEIDKLTALVGRNESGKTNLLLALASLNPASGRKHLVPIKDFPRSWLLEKCNDNTPVVTTQWKLTADETAQITKTLGCDEPVCDVEIGRPYGTNCWVKFKDLKEPTLDGEEAQGILRRLGPTLSVAMNRIDDEERRKNASDAWERLERSDDLVADPKRWAAEVNAAAKLLRTRLGEAAVILDEEQDGLLAQLERKATLIAGFDNAHAIARELVLGWLPRFIYVSDFPELCGHQNLDEYTQRRGLNPATRERENNFERLTKVADFRPDYLNAHRNDHETRSQILNRAGAKVTEAIRRLWKDRQLMVRFNIDGPHLDVLVSDSTAYYPVEVNLDERSRGFRWFFSFYITFAADTQDGDAAGAVLLLDEPGLHLHAKSQEDLLRHLQNDYPNQIVYTTHSPYMLPADSISIARTVDISHESGTKVTNNANADQQKSAVVPGPFWRRMLRQTA